jgi:adenylate cyclase
LAAAEDILEKTRELSEKWKKEKGFQTEIGISLNTGIAFVGFLGPSQKLEYTAVGDTVNLSVRLQEHTKRFHTRLIMSEYTIQALALSGRTPNGMISLGEVSIRGRESKLQIYTITRAINPNHTHPDPLLEEETI